MLSKTRLQRKREKDSLKQAFKYLILVFGLLFLLIRFGLPGLIKMAAFFGEIRQSKLPIEQTQIRPILPPRLNPLPMATNSAEINVSGYAQAGSTIRLFLRGISLDEMIVEANGQFEFKAVHLKEGENEIYLKASDNQNTVSEPSMSYVVIVDNITPELEIFEPSEGERFFDQDNPITISGKTEPDLNLSINSRFVLVKNDGSFSTTLSLSEGDNPIEAVVRDLAGNETKKSLKVNYTP
ncbi:MAG: hypothetical protein V1810_04485 [Candidatus Beckwithbacteria bacterium]